MRIPANLAGKALSLKVYSILRNPLTRSLARTRRQKKKDFSIQALSSTGGGKTQADVVLCEWLTLYAGM